MVIYSKQQRQRAQMKLKVNYKNQQRYLVLDIVILETTATRGLEVCAQYGQVIRLAQDVHRSSRFENQ